MSRILVFGSTGRQGTSCVRCLLNCGERVAKVRAYCSVVTPILHEIQQHHKDKIECYVADITDPSALRNAMNDMDTVVLIQNPLHYGETIEDGCAKENEIGQEIINLATNSSNIKNFVFSSWISAGAAKGVLPLKTKYNLEDCLRTKKLKFERCCLLRPAVFFDHLLLDTTLSHNKLSLPFHPHTNVPWVSINDVGAALAQCCIEPTVSTSFRNNIIELVGEVLQPAEMAETLNVAYEQSPLAHVEDKYHAQLMAFIQTEPAQPDTALSHQAFPFLKNFQQFADANGLLNKTRGNDEDGTVQDCSGLA
ncbi:hypothetical protein P9112_014139 [Eukaryota sp. TZLM1-RC]